MLRHLTAFITSLLILGGGVANASAITYQVLVRPIVVCDDLGNNCADTGGFFEEATDKIWAQAGIDIVFMDINEYWWTPFLTRDGSSTANAALSVFEMYATVAPLDMVIDMWFIEEFTSDSIGGGISSFGLTFFGDLFSSITISDDVIEAGRLDVLAHEIGHSLGLFHCGDPGAACSISSYNLMTGSGDGRISPTTPDDIYPDGDWLDQLNAEQIALVFNPASIPGASGQAPDFVQLIPTAVVPEPASLFLLGAGLAGVTWRTRRQRRS